MEGSTTQEIFLVTRRVGDDVVTFRDTQFHVDFNFCCDLFVWEYCGNVMVRNTVHPSIMTTSVRMGIKQLMDSECSRRMINQELGEWPLDDEHRRDLSEVAFIAVKNLIRLMPAQHNVLVIPLNVLVVCNRQVERNYLATQLMVRQSIEEAVSRMIPATDSSIESLEMKTVSTTLHEDGDGSCSICLEDFYVGCEVLSMPCSHVFHGNCIKKWLKSSHYCPICRFEMPTRCY